MQSFLFFFLGFVRLVAEEHGAADLRQGVGAAHGHGVGELGAELVHIDLHALSAAR